MTTVTAGLPERLSRPRSAVGQRQTLAILIVFALGVLIFKGEARLDAQQSFLALMSVLVVACCAAEWTYLKATWRRAREARSDGRRGARVFVKVIGLWATFGVLACYYWLFPLYRLDPENIFFSMWWPSIAVVGALAPGYVWFVDRSMEDSEDGLYMTGLLALGRYGRVDWLRFRTYALGWGIKAFFLPFMLKVAYQEWLWLRSIEVSSAFLADSFAWFELLFRGLYWVDVTWASAGYLLTLRALDTHIRSAENTVDGWLVCLVCYPPFWPALGHHFFAYSDGFTWGAWLDGHLLAKQAWASVLIFLVFVYTWSTISFGARFSNLTHRGIITSGPYRWVKHPAYLAKNLSWWMIAVPFVVVDGNVLESARLCLLLCGINAIYYWRARTEERHLSSDPAYVAYAQWIDERGAFAQLRSISTAMFVRIAALVRAEP